MNARITAALLLLFFTGTLFAQADLPKRGLYVSFHPNHKKAWVGKCRHYQKHGKWKYYDEEGHLLKTEPYSRGKLNGVKKEFFPNGKTAFEGAYINDKPEGDWKTWGPEGQLLQLFNYKDGQPVGTWQYWYSNGKIRRTEYYLAGKKEGVQHEFWENGNPKTDISMTGGIRNGLTINYDSNGKRVSQTEYVNDIKHGLEQEWKNEQLVNASEYRNGLLNGYVHRWNTKGDTLEWATYVNNIREGQTIRWKNNKRVSEEFYVNDKQQGQCNYYDRQTGKLLYIRWMNAGKPDSLQTFYPNGQRQNRECFNDAGLRNGRYFEWSENGNVLVTGYYFNGQKQFVWKVFYPNGNLKSIATYQLGSLSGAYSRYYANGKKMFLQQFAVGEAETRVEGKPQIWDENGKPLKPGSTQYEAIKSSVYVEETFVKPVNTDKRYPPAETTNSTAIDPPVEQIGTDVSPMMITKNDLVVEQDDPVFTFAEKMPVFPGGEAVLYKYIADNTRKPEGYSDTDSRGVVYVNFVVNADGSIRDVKVMKEMKGKPEFSEEAVRVIKNMPRWEPGKMQGRPVAVSMTIPVRFN